MVERSRLRRRRAVAAALPGLVDDAKVGVVLDLLILVGLVIATWVLRPSVA